MFALCGIRTRDLFRSRRVFRPLRQIGRRIRKKHKLFVIHPNLFYHLQNMLRQKRIIQSSKHFLNAGIEISSRPANK
jgi:hypothetical protein